MKQTPKIKDISVIVTDDHPIFRIALANIVRQIQFVNDVAEASDGKTAINMLRQKHYHFVLMDVRMKGMNGDIASGIICKQFPETKVIAVSAYEDIFTIRRMFLVGCSGYITKDDCNEKTIKEALLTISTGKKYIQKGIAEKLTGESEEESFARMAREFTLSLQESKLIQLVCLGKANKQIADELNVSLHTIKKYRNNAYHKIGVNSSVELMHFALRHGIIMADDL